MGKSKKKKKNKKPIAIQIGKIDRIGFYPGSDNKTAVVIYSLADPTAVPVVTSYSIEWLVYPVGGDRFYTASTSSSSTDSATYDIPTNAIAVLARVKVSGVTDTKLYSVGGNIAQSEQLPVAHKVTTPPAPTITITDKTKAIAKIENYSDTSPAKTNKLKIEIIKRDGGSLTSLGWHDVESSNGYAAYSFNVDLGYYYKARAYAVGDASKNTANSDESQYGAEVTTIPGTVGKITSIKCEPNHGDDTWPVYLSWTGVGNADKYKIEYTMNRSYFDTESDEVYSVETEGKSTSRYVTSNISGGHIWYFRVRAVNSVGTGDPCSPVSVVVGSKPAAPTTWSYETVLKIGEKAVLCWTHNATDGSFMEQAKIQWKIGPSGTPHTETVIVKSTDGQNQTQDTNPDKVVTTYKWELDTTGFADSSVIYWKVQTKGVVAEFGDFSTERQITVYEPPTISVSISDGDDVMIPASEVTGATLYNDYLVVTAFPLAIHSITGPQTQTPIGLNYEITAEEDYEILIEDGTEIYVVAGEMVYKRYATVSEHDVTLTLNPGDIFLNNNTRYSLRVVVAMSNGLTAEVVSKFLTHWDENDCGLSAKITIDTDNLIAFVRPFAYDPSTNVEITEGYLLSVYRREVNATFDLIASNLDVADNTTIADIHPALDYARYRIVGINKNNGTISFYDMPGEEVGETGIVIHWNESWRPIDEGMPSYDFLVDMQEDYKMGSLLKIPYNVDINDDMGKEVSLINYAGRTYPVSYYGTQRSLTSKWTVQVPKTDKQTINAIRRLAMYGGDSYVREPNGTGYWAALNLSYVINHNTPLVSVNINITRVEGEDKGVISESSQTIWTETVEEQEG